MVKIKYFPNNGIASDVGGIISANSRKNTVSDTRIEMLKEIYGENFIAKVSYN